MNTIDPKQYNDPAVHSLFCGGDTVTGDEIVFVESVFGGSFPQADVSGVSPDHRQGRQGFIRRRPAAAHLHDRRRA